jgi:poly(A) polymerase
VGKPGTRAFNTKKGRITFYGHAEQGTEIVLQMCERLKMSKKMTRFITLLIEEHMHVLALSAPEVKNSTKMKFLRKTGDDCLALFILAIADLLASRGEASCFYKHKEQIKWCKDMLHEYLTHIKQYLESQELLKGNDLLELGLRPGPQLGRILKEIKKARDNGEISTKEEALNRARKYT